ncbi:MAG: accessory gene regulator B family protein [Clostridiales bacterium]|nr:accessory gene regulator B family protein [Clostridiales bacterium]
MRKYFSFSSDRSELEKAQILYGIQVLWHNIKTTVIIFAAALLLDVLCGTFWTFLSFGMFRMFAGGLHLNTTVGCLLTTGSIAIGGGILGEYLIFHPWLLFCIYCLILTGVVLFAPQGTVNNPFSEDNQKKMKKRSMILVLIYAVISISGIEKISSWITIGAIAELITVIILYVQKKSVRKKG